jgi:hypothetical protein
VLLVAFQANQCWNLWKVGILGNSGDLGFINSRDLAFQFQGLPIPEVCNSYDLTFHPSTYIVN